MSQNSPTTAVSQVGPKSVLDVNLAGSAGSMPQASGTITALASVVHTAVAAAGNATIQIVGGVTTNAVYAFEGSLDGTNWFAIDATRADGTGVDVQTPPISFTAGVVRAWNVILTATAQIRVRNVSGTITTAPTVVIAPGPMLAEFSPVTRDFLSGSGQRTIFTASFSGVPATTEAMLSMVPVRAGVAGAGVTSLTVTAGKTLRLQSMGLSLRNSATTAASAVINLRYASGAAATVTSLIMETLGALVGNLLANGSGGATITFGSDGIEFPAGYQFGVSMIGVATGTAIVTLKGYEYA